MTPKVSRKTVALVVFLVLLTSLGFMIVVQFFGQSSTLDLKVLVVTGEGLQETYGFYDESHVGNGFYYSRDTFWTESTDKWNASTRYASISTDYSKKVHGDSSVLVNFNTRYSSYFFYHLSRSYGYLAMEGDKWLYFDIMFNATTQIKEFEVRVANYGGTRYFFTKYTNTSGYTPNEWIRFKIYMNNMTISNTPSWSDIAMLQFHVQLSSGTPLQIWIDDIMMTSNYHYRLALKNLQTIFKGVSLDARDYDKLPSSLDNYAAVVYFDNRINSTGVSMIDQYVNKGGGLVLMGLSTLWNTDGTERIDFPLSSSPVSIINTTETFIDKADKADSFENHPALKPWSDDTIFVQKGFAGSRPIPYLGVAEVYNVSLRADATELITESGYVYEVTKQYGAGKVIYFAENMAKRIANGMLEATRLTHGMGSLGWAGATGDRLQLLESAVNYVSKQPLPKILMVPFAKKGGFVFTVETFASISFYSYQNKSCTNISGSPSNDTAFWYTVERMKSQSEETGVKFTLLIATEQLVNESRPSNAEIEFDPKNIEALLAAYQSSNIEIGLSTSNLATWSLDSTSIAGSYLNMWQGTIDLRNALNLSDYLPLVWRYPDLAKRGESMYGTEQAGLYLDVSDGTGSGGVPYSDSVAVPYMMEVGTWKLQNRGSFVQRVESIEVLMRLEEAYFDWYVENDMIYAANTNDISIAADPTHTHEEISGTRNYTSKWTLTPTFLQYVSAQAEDTWIVGGVTLAQYLKDLNAAEVTTTYDAGAKTYTFTVHNAPNGLTLRLPLNGLHVSNLATEVDYILKEQGSNAYIALKNPKSLEKVKVTLGSVKMAGITQMVKFQRIEGYLLFMAAFSAPTQRLMPPLLEKSRRFKQNRRESFFTRVSFPNLYHNTLSLSV